MSKPHILLVTNLFPSSAEPTRGIFTRQQMEDLREWYDITVVAPYPWAPAWARKLLKTGIDVPPLERIGDFDVHHPRYLVTPKIGRSLYGFFFFFGIFFTLLRLKRQLRPALISAHWMYPDAFGAALAARLLGLPLVVHALGCDINDYSRYFWRRLWLRLTLRGSNRTITVSTQLRDRCIAIGGDPARIQVVLNGVDGNKFQPRDPSAARQTLGLPADRKIILFVGNYNVEKGLEHLVEAFKPVAEAHPEALLCIAGSGPLEAAIQQQIDRLGIGGQIKRVGRVPHADVPTYLNAANLLCLPSLREGCPNIILEALSSGTPVVSSNVGAVPDILATLPFKAGILVEPGNASALSRALLEALETPLTLPQGMDWMDWRESARQVADLYQATLREAARH